MKNSEFETVQEAAERLGVTVRAVQKWAGAGRIPGAEKFGKSWLIPKDVTVVDNIGAKQEQKETVDISTQDTSQSLPPHMIMPLLNSNYPVGGCMEYIKSMPDPDDRNIALAEYYYYSGRAEESARTAEPYLSSSDPALHFSANLLYIFSNLAAGHSQLSRFAIRNLQEQTRRGLTSDSPRPFRAAGIFTATAASVLLHIPVPPMPPLEEYINDLPAGLRLWACYVLAHKSYLEQEYDRGLAIADMGLVLVPNASPIAKIYVHIVAAMALVNMKRVEDAKHRIDVAWNLAKLDDLIQPFGEHHGLLQGMIEIYFKKDHPKDFKRIIDITYAFSAEWRVIHNSVTKHEVADNLSTMEFTIAMLLTRNWSYKEIAGYLQISERNISGKISDIYSKLGVADKIELAKFMLA